MQKLQSKYTIGCDPVVLKNLTKIEAPVSERRADFEKMMMAVSSIPLIEAAVSGYLLACARHDIDEDDPKFLSSTDDIRRLFTGPTESGEFLLERSTDFLQTGLKHVLHEYPGLILKGIIKPYCVINIDSDESQKEQWEAAKDIFCTQTMSLVNHVLHSALVENERGELITEAQAQDESIDKNIEKLAAKTGQSADDIKNNVEIIPLELEEGEDKEAAVRRHISQKLGVSPDEVVISSNEYGAVVAVSSDGLMAKEFWHHVSPTPNTLRPLTFALMVGKLSLKMLSALRALKFGGGGKNE